MVFPHPKKESWTKEELEELTEQTRQILEGAIGPTPTVCPLSAVVFAIKAHQSIKAARKNSADELPTVGLGRMTGNVAVA
jgi:hypothetical protein